MPIYNCLIDFFASQFNNTNLLKNMSYDLLFYCNINIKQDNLYPNIIAVYTLTLIVNFS